MKRIMAQSRLVEVLVLLPFTLITALVLLAVFSLGQSDNDEGALHEQLTGAWVGEMGMTADFDWENGVFLGVVFGEEYETQIKLVSEDEAGKVVKYTSDDNLIVCTFLDDGRILLRKDIEGGIPLIFERSE